MITARHFFLLCLLLTGCAPATLEELRWEGEAETRKLTQELGKIASREELQRALPRLRKRYTKIASLVVQARKWEAGTTQGPSAESEELFIQLARLYEIPGAKELIESAQQEAIRRLDRDL